LHYNVKKVPDEKAQETGIWFAIMSHELLQACQSTIEVKKEKALIWQFTIS
jgi:hypothetical protein